jgi:hypothetical protein
LSQQGTADRRGMVWKAVAPSTFGNLREVDFGR